MAEVVVVRLVNVALPPLARPHIANGAVQEHELAPVYQVVLQLAVATEVARIGALGNGTIKF